MNKLRREELLKKALKSAELWSDLDARLSWLEGRFETTEEFLDNLKKDHETCSEEERLMKLFK